MKPSEETSLKKHYYRSDRVGSYGGVERLSRVTKQKKTKVKDWLSFQDTYTLHKPVRKTFPRRQVIVSGRLQQFQADLIDLRTLKKANDGYSYLVTCIDVFSKFAWCVPLKDKFGSSLVKAFKEIFRKTLPPRRLQTDKGTEFKNREFQEFLKEKKIHFFTTENEDIKASIVERFNRTLKERMWRYFTFRRTLRYLEEIPKLLRSYNNSPHRSIGMTPSDVNDENQEEVWQRLYGLKKGGEKKQTHQLSVGDRVRLAKMRGPFKKGYTPSWTQELFTIDRLHCSNPPTYIIVDDAGEKIAGTFYEQEVQKVGDKPTYRIDEILKQRRGKGGKKEYLIRWAGYDASFDSWIGADAVTTYRG